MDAYDLQKKGTSKKGKGGGGGGGELQGRSQARIFSQLECLFSLIPGTLEYKLHHVSVPLSPGHLAFVLLC